MLAAQLKLLNLRSEDCPFVELLEEDDDNCFKPGKENGYEVMYEGHPDLPKWLADVRGVGFDNVIARQNMYFDLPVFMPTITAGSKNLFVNHEPEWVAVSLRDVISDKKLLPIKDVRKHFGLKQDTKVVLLNYARDGLIERIWPERKVIFRQLAQLGFDLMTSVNYSIWLSQPHAERLINMKRSLITFEELQDLGIPTIPHIYWTGKKDIERWSEWLSKNKNVSYVAINLQTERDYRNGLWERTLEDLQYFNSLLNRDIHFFITGASTKERIIQLRKVLPNLTTTNGSCARKAACSYLITENRGKMETVHVENFSKNEIMDKNMNFYTSLMSVSMQSLIVTNNIR